MPTLLPINFLNSILKESLRVAQALATTVVERGAADTFRLALQRTLPWNRRALDEHLRARRVEQAAAISGFDEVYGVVTAGVRSIDQLNIQSSNAHHGRSYEPVLPHEFQRILSTAGTVFEGRTFVDLGSGKGRALLLASRYPFREVIGVEFAEELAQQARSNVRAFEGRSERVSPISVIHGDACEFEFPPTPLVVFLFNPFGASVMDRVVGRIASSMQHNPRPLTVLYANPIFDNLWNREPRLKSMLSRTDKLGYDGPCVPFTVRHYGRA